MNRLRLLFLLAMVAGTGFAQLTPVTTQAKTAAWTTSTAGGAVGTGAVVMYPTQGYTGATVALNQGSTIAAGVVTFEVSDTVDASVTNNWYPLQCTATDTGTPGSTYTLQASTNKGFNCPVGGWPRFEVRLSTGITGTATVNVSVTLNSLASPSSAPPATGPVSGTVAISQTTPGTTNAVQATNLPATADTNEGNPGASTLRTVPTNYGTVLSGQQAVTASAVALATNAVQGTCVKALAGNTIPVYVGPSGITTATGDELAPGEVRCFAVSNTNLLFVIASTTGASISWSGVK